MLKLRNLETKNKKILYKRYWSNIKEYAQIICDVLNIKVKRIEYTKNDLLNNVIQDDVLYINLKGREDIQLYFDLTYALRRIWQNQRSEDTNERYYGSFTPLNSPGTAEYITEIEMFNDTDADAFSCNMLMDAFGLKMEDLLADVPPQKQKSIVKRSLYLSFPFYIK